MSIAIILFSARSFADREPALARILDGRVIFPVEQSVVKRCEVRSGNWQAPSMESRNVSEETEGLTVDIAHRLQLEDR